MISDEPIDGDVVDMEFVEDEDVVELTVITGNAIWKETYTFEKAERTYSRDETDE